MPRPPVRSAAALEPPPRTEREADARRPSEAAAAAGRREGGSLPHAPARYADLAVRTASQRTRRPATIGVVPWAAPRAASSNDDAISCGDGRGDGASSAAPARRPSGPALCAFDSKGGPAASAPRKCTCFLGVPLCAGATSLESRLSPAAVDGIAASRHCGQLEGVVPCGQISVRRADRRGADPTGS